MENIPIQPELDGDSIGNSKREQLLAAGTVV